MTNTRLQDAFSCFLTGPADQYFVAIVSDGAGSAKFGGQGASLVCRTMGTYARRYLTAEKRLPSDADIYDWTDAIRDRLAPVASRRRVALREFAATLVCLISDGEETLLAHVGDGCAVIRKDGAEEWLAASWPEHGEYASTTYFMTDEVEIRLRITRHGGRLSAAALMSDGLERLALDFTNKVPFARFFNAVISPVAASPGNGKDALLSAELKAYLGSDAIASRTDDDRTLVLAVRQ